MNFYYFCFVIHPHLSRTRHEDSPLSTLYVYALSPLHTSRVLITQIAPFPPCRYTPYPPSHLVCIRPIPHSHLVGIRPIPPSHLVGIRPIPHSHLSRTRHEDSPLSTL